MVEQSNQLGFKFDIEIELKKSVKYCNKKSRGKKIYRNDIDITGTVKDDNIWGEMQKVYEQIASYCPTSLSEKDIGYKDYNGMRIWYDLYTSEAYIYNGAIFSGKPGLCIHAEIIGTENYTVEKRYKIHTLLLRQLKQGKTISEALSASFV